jgi:hypothetical protein
MPTVGFEPTISAGDRPQTDALDRAATGIGKQVFYQIQIINYTLYKKGWNLLHKQEDNPTDSMLNIHTRINFTG